MEEKYKRINILITPEQHRQASQAGLSLSGLIRDLLHDRFSEKTITLSVSKRCKKLYDEVVSNFGMSDAELEKYIIEALDKLLLQKERDIESLRKKLKN